MSEGRGQTGKPLLYVNSGSWGIDSHDRKTYLRIDGARANIQLCEWVLQPTGADSKYREDTWHSRYIPRPPPTKGKVDGVEKALFQEDFVLGRSNINGPYKPTHGAIPPGCPPPPAKW